MGYLYAKDFEHIQLIKQWHVNYWNLSQPVVWFLSKI